MVTQFSFAVLFHFIQPLPAVGFKAQDTDTPNIQNTNRIPTFDNREHYTIPMGYIRYLNPLYT